MKKDYYASEALFTALFLSLSGGLQDAYTYLVRGHVFANAQTGNIVLLSLNLFDGSWEKILLYLIPITSFALGVIACEAMRTAFVKKEILHWRQYVIASETVLLFFVGLIPHKMDLLASSIVSFSCAMQVQAFRKLEGNPFSSTMCIGNLRSGMEALYHYAGEREHEKGKKALHYFLVILMFALGAGIGGIAVRMMAERAIWISCCLLIFCFMILFDDRKKSTEW